MRSLPPTVLTAILAAQSNETLLSFVTISDGTNTYNYVNDNVDIVKGGVTFHKAAFLVVDPAESMSAVDDAVFEISTVDLTIIPIIRNAVDRLTVTMSAALASAPDATPLISLGTFPWVRISYNQYRAKGTLTYEDMLDNLFPALTFSANVVPGVH